MRLMFSAKVEGGELKVGGMEQFETFLRALEGQEVYLEIGLRNSHIRTIQQNKLYWFYLKLISGETGETPQKLHLDFKERFLKKPVNPDNLKSNLDVQTRETTTELTRTEFIDYLNNIVKLMAEFNIVLPEPYSMLGD